MHHFITRAHLVVGIFIIGTAFTGPSAHSQAAGPSLKSAWKAEVAADSRRIAVADMTGDMKPNLLLLGKEGALTIFSISGATPEKIGTSDLGKGAVQFVAGKFAKGKPGVISVPGALLYKEGDKFVRKEVGDLGDITGVSRFTDGSEGFFFFEGMGPPASYVVDLGASKPIVAGPEMRSPDMGEGFYDSVVAHLKSEVLDQFGLPEEARKAGVIGFFATKSGGKLYACIPWLAMGESYLQMAEMASLFGGGGNIQTVWKSPKLAGKLLDFTIGADPKTGKGAGIYVLTESGAEGKGRQVEDFAVDKP